MGLRPRKFMKKGGAGASAWRSRVPTLDSSPRLAASPLRADPARTARAWLACRIMLRFACYSAISSSTRSSLFAGAPPPALVEIHRKGLEQLPGIRMLGRCKNLLHRTVLDDFPFMQNRQTMTHRRNRKQVVGN
jgi:hypothetical protein